MIKVNGHVVEPTIFPDKTSQVWKLPKSIYWQQAEVEWIFESEGEFMHLAQLRDLLGPSSALYMPYLPYARQDKHIANENCFALRTFAKLLNTLSFAEVSCFDPHSDLTGIIDKVVQVYPIHEVRRIFREGEYTSVCYPDGGAERKYANKIGLPSILASKSRDSITGEITVIELCRSRPALDENVLIVDDICDGGNTFTLLTKQLYAHGAKSVSLYVSHGLFSKGLAPFWDAGIKRIFTKDGEVHDTRNSL